MKTLRTVWLATVLAGFALGQDPAAGMAKVQQLEQQFTTLRGQLDKDFAGLTNLPESEREAAGDKLYAAFLEAAEAIVDQLVAIGTDDHGALGLAAVTAAFGMNLTKAQRASLLEIVGDHHVGNAGIARLLPRLRYASGKTIDALLQRVLDENPAQEAKGTALFVIAQRTKDSSREALFERCVKEFADVELAGNTIGKLAADQLVVIRDTKVGGTPPDIVGKDMDGVAFKLSDYRGKVVVLDFWGYW